MYEKFQKNTVKSENLSQPAVTIGMLTYQNMYIDYDDTVCESLVEIQQFRMSYIIIMYENTHKNATKSKDFP